MVQYGSELGHAPGTRVRTETCLAGSQLDSGYSDLNRKQLPAETDHASWTSAPR